MIGKRILILIPHPHDEVVGCAAAIARARAQGARVFGVNLSHGCLPSRAMWWWERSQYQRVVDQRLAESLAVAEFLGIKQLNGNVMRAAREIWPNLQTVYGEVMQAMQICAPDRIWVPAYEGASPDYDAVNALASCIARTVGQVSVFEMAQYHFAHGIPHSNAFIAIKGTEIKMTLTANEQKMKRAALKLYASEQKNLGDVDVRYETFRPIAQYDYSKRPHEGTLWYERFQWVPFAHPRVDVTKAATVSKAIMDFLGKQ